MNIYFLLMFFGSFMSAFSQLLLKQSANKSHKSLLKEYMNFRVIFAYILLASSLFLNVYAFRGVPYKFAPIFTAAIYIFSLILSAVVLKEKIKGKILGNAIIFLGIIIYLL